MESSLESAVLWTVQTLPSALERTGFFFFNLSLEQEELYTGVQSCTSYRTWKT